MTTASRPPADTSPHEASAARRQLSRLVGVLALALAARLVVMALWPENLTDDRDEYLSLAEGLADGRGFSIPDTAIPTAYRPPLYPLTLVPSAFLPSAFWVGTLHVVLGVATVWLTWRLATGLTIPWPDREQAAWMAVLASMFVAVDPILLRYTTFPMTETVAVFLVTALLVGLSQQHLAKAGTQRTGSCVGRSVLVGILFGLTALCRPTVWAFAAVMGLWGAIRWVRKRIPLRRSVPDANSSFRNPGCTSGIGLNWWITLAAVAIVVLPWVVRNMRVLGHPILMTTHGGYTLLLGNNPDFDREVVRQRWGTVWDGSHGGGQARWADEINRTMDEAGLTTEVARDRWMQERAKDNILSDPGAFARACWLRFRRFWGIVPVEGASDAPKSLRWTVATFYVLLFLGALAGLLVVLRQRLHGWGPSLLMVLVFMSVHLVYWTNTRMRAPIVPVIAVLSAVGWVQLWIVTAHRTDFQVRPRMRENAKSIGKVRE